MVRMSTARDLSRVDGLTALERARRQPLMLGLFIPLQQGAWSPSTWTRGTSWDFAYNAECTVRAEELGFDVERFDKEMADMRTRSGSERTRP